MAAPAKPLPAVVLRGPRSRTRWRPPVACRTNRQCRCGREAGKKGGSRSASLPAAAAAMAARWALRRAQSIGQWREAQGLAASTSGYGPLRDLPDWSFVDGRPAPPWKRQERRDKENLELVRRAVKLSKVLEEAARKEAPSTQRPPPALKAKNRPRPARGPAPTGSGPA